jgi:4-hydroxybenzoate polyprenyltransferase
MKEKIIDYIRLFRLQGIGLFAITPLLGALSTGIKEITPLIFLFIIGTLQYIYLFVSNDVVDIDVDKQVEELRIRPLVKGTISKQTGIFISFFCFIMVYLLTFLFFFRNNSSFYLGLICLTLAATVGTINNIYGKKFAFSAFLAGGAQALIIPYAAYMVSDTIHLNEITITISLLFFTQTLFMTAISGGIKDADHDFKKNVKNYATKMGVTVNESDKKLIIPKSFIAFGMGIRIFSAILISAPIFFLKLNYSIWQIFLIFIFTLIVIISTIKMFRFRYYDREKLRKNIIVQIIFRSVVVPMLLFPIIGEIKTIIFVLFAFLCYIVCMELIKFLNKSREYYS